MRLQNFNQFKLLENKQINVFPWQSIVAAFLLNDSNITELYENLKTNKINQKQISDNEIPFLISKNKNIICELQNSIFSLIENLHIFNNAKELADNIKKNIKIGKEIKIKDNILSFDDTELIIQDLNDNLNEIYTNKILEALNVHNNYSSMELDELSKEWFNAIYSTCNITTKKNIIKFLESAYKDIDWIREKLTWNDLQNIKTKKNLGINYANISESQIFTLIQLLSSIYDNRAALCTSNITKYKNIIENKITNNIFIKDNLCLTLNEKLYQPLKNGIILFGNNICDFEIKKLKNQKIILETEINENYHLVLNISRKWKNNLILSTPEYTINSKIEDNN